METFIALTTSLTLVLSLFSIIRDKKYKVWQAEKDLKLKEIELEETNIKNDSLISKDSGNQKLYDQRKRDLEKISADIDHLRKIIGNK